ncbi:transposase, MuDR, MULE transposase domain protein [Tanacetum coccineum]
MFEDLTYSRLHEMMMKKFNLEANYRLNLSVKLSLLDYTFDITDEAEIRTFLNCLRPLLRINATHLKSLYKRTNLVAVGMVGNNQIVPIAFGICKGETSSCWSWWMLVLKECIGDNLNLLFISDRRPSIALAVYNEFPLAFHATMTLKVLLHHYGRFTSLLGREFVGEMVATVDPIELDTLFNRSSLVPLADAIQERDMILTEFKLNPLTYQDGSVPNIHVLPMDFQDMVIYLKWKIPRRFTTLYYTLPPNNTLSGIKAIKNEYDTNFMYDIAKVAGKLQIFVSHNPIDLSTVLIPNDGSLEESFAEAHDEEACLEEQILSLMHRFADRFINHRPEINRLMTLHDHPLIEYGRYALGCMTAADMKNATYLKSASDELLRSMKEKRQLI